MKPTTPLRISPPARTQHMVGKTGLVSWTRTIPLYKWSLRQFARHVEKPLHSQCPLHFVLSEIQWISTERIYTAPLWR